MIKIKLASGEKFELSAEEVAKAIRYYIYDIEYKIGDLAEKRDKAKLFHDGLIAEAEADKERRAALDAELDARAGVLAKTVTIYERLQT